MSDLADKFERLRDMPSSGMAYHNDFAKRELHVYGKADATDETGWLIEWPEDELHKVRWYVPGKIFTSNANEALRFARKEDAEAFIRKGEKFSMAGHAKAVEHAWIAPAVCRTALEKARGEDESA